MFAYNILYADTNIFNAAIEAFNSKNYKMAENYFNKFVFNTVENNKLKITSFDYLSKIAEINKNYKLAIKYLKIILKNFLNQNELPDYYLRVANLYFHIGDLENALQYYNFIIIKFPDSFESELAKIKIEEIQELSQLKE